MRTTDQILADMDSVQATIPEAATLTSKSKTSVFGLLRSIWASFVQSLEAYMDTLKDDLTTYIASIQVGGIAWYVGQVKAFQYGDALTIINGKPAYQTIDPTKQIVSQVAVVEVDGRLLIKTAKPTPDQLQYQALSSDELAALKEYVRQVKYAGVGVDVVSLPPDELQIKAICKYDPQVMNAQGQRLTNTVSLPALEAVILFIRQLPFNSVLNWTQLTDFAQTYDGVLDFVITGTAIRPAGSADWTSFVRETSSRAGHLKLVDAQIQYV